MALVFVSEYGSVGNDFGNAPVADEGSLQAEYTLAIGGTSVQGAVLRPGTRFLRVHADAVCSVAFGPNPTALATGKRLAAGQTEYFKVPEAKSWRVACITNV
jgi:hypothetical protein